MFSGVEGGGADDTCCLSSNNFVVTIELYEFLLFTRIGHLILLYYLYLPRWMVVLQVGIWITDVSHGWGLFVVILESDN